MSHVLFADLLGLSVVVGIEIAARQREAALVKLRHGLLRVVIILYGGQAEQRSEGGVIIDGPGVSNRGMLVGKLVNQLGFLLEIVNALQLRLESFGKGGFNRAFIHATLPVVADLLLHRGSTLFLGRGRFQCLAQHCLIPLLQRTGYAPGRAVRRNGIGSKKFAASVLVKIRAGIDLGIYLVSAQVLKLGQFFRRAFLLGKRKS